MAFKCTVVTVEQQLFDETVSGAIVPAHDGLVGIQTGRAPILMKLGAGPLTLHRTGGGGDAVYFIDGGVAQMKDDVLTILTDQAMPPEQIDVAAARAELESANAPETTTEASAGVRERKSRRARAMLRMAGVAE